ncbi:MAG: hypothetical protein J6Z01_08760 [Bacteroidales bacterium]|nr:hypothetical protein [Bacteroidales bacterium]
MKVLCIIWDIGGIYALFKVISESRGDGAVIVGALIGFALICVLPSYFCFRDNKSKNTNGIIVKQTTKPNTTNKHDAVSHYADLQSEYPKTTIPMQQDKPNLISAEYSTENYKERLKRLCHPQNFINNDNYDKDKVAYANSIYTELFRGSNIDYYALIAKAEAKLGLNLLDEVDYNSLKEKLNPQNFMEPYNPNKIALANELYAKILDPFINCTKFFEIRSQAKPLLDYLKSINEPKSTAVWTTDAQPQQQKKQKKIPWWDKTTKLFALIFLCYILFMFITYQTDIKDRNQNKGINYQSTINDNTHDDYQLLNETTDNSPSSKMKQYSSNLYSISYPSYWLCVEHPNDNIDVAFGQTIGIAFSIFHIDSDQSLKNIVDYANKEMQLQFSAKILSNNIIKLCNIDCYKTTYTFSYGNTVDNKQISYALKKGRTYYNIRFNGDKYDIDNNAQLIETIINTFELK